MLLPGLHQYLWPPMNLTFDCSISEADRFMPLPRGTLVTICSKIGFQNVVFISLPLVTFTFDLLTTKLTVSCC